MDSRRLNALGWQAKVKLEQGLALAYQDFLDCHVADAPRNDDPVVIASEARQSMNPDSSLRAKRGNP
jgi:hypothetical protein